MMCTKVDLDHLPLPGLGLQSKFAIGLIFSNFIALIVIEKNF